MDGHIAQITEKRALHAETVTSTAAANPATGAGAAATDKAADLFHQAKDTVTGGPEQLED